MGIDFNVLQHFRDRFPIRNLVLDGPPLYSGGFDDDEKLDYATCTDVVPLRVGHEGLAVLVDIMPDSYRTHTKDTDGEVFTSLDFYEQTVADMRDAFRVHPGITHYALFADDRYTVVSEKATCQQQRNTGVVEYPAQCTIVDRGVQLPDGTVQSILSTRLMATRSLRINLFYFLLRRMMRDKRLHAFNVWFVFATEGPYEMHHGKTTLHRHLAALTGEADNQVWIQAMRFAQQGCHLLIRYVDRDTIAIGLRLVQSFCFPRSVYLMTKSVDKSSSSSASVFSSINLLGMAKRLEDKHWPIDAFFYALLLSGTDFLLRAHTAHRIEQAVVFDVVLHAYREYGDQVMNDFDCFARMVRLFYNPVGVKAFHQWSNQEQRNAHMDISKPVPVPKHSMPPEVSSDTALRKTFVLYRMNNYYWTTLHDWIVLDDDGNVTGVRDTERVTDSVVVT